jgi:hypothetical protein
MSISVVVTTLTAFLVVYFGSKVLSRLPLPKREIEFINRSAGRDNFAVWIVADELWFDEFEVGHVDHWLSGHKFSSWGDAEFSPELNLTRATFNFYSAIDALSGTNIIGWGKIGSMSVELHISLTPEVAKNLIDELRINANPTLHAQGFYVEDDKVKITYFRLAPSTE